MRDFIFRRAQDVAFITLAVVTMSWLAQVLIRIGDA